MTTTATKKAASKPDSADEGESRFSDITDAQEQAAKDAQEPVEFDDDGNPKPRSSEAAAKVADEMSLRAAAQANGGGAWPEDLLLKNFVGSGQRLRAPQPEYTSHEDSE